MNYTREEWISMIRRHTAGNVPVATIEGIAELCVSNPGWGVWHAAAQYLGKGDRCMCTPCMQARAVPK
jgi:hypothetical protein